MDNYEAMKPWEHGKIVEIHHDIKSLSVYPIVYENKSLYVCRVSGSTEVIIVRKSSSTNYVFESYEKYQIWRQRNPLANLSSRHFYVHIPKGEKISFADNFPVRDFLDEALAKAEFAYEEKNRTLERLRLISDDYINRIEIAEDDLKNKMNVINDIKAKIAERDKNNNGI